MKKLFDQPQRARNSGALSLKGISYLFLLIVLIAALPVLPAAARPAQQAVNVALNKPVTCSPAPQFPCAEAVDGNTGTRWASAQGVDPQFIYVDLGATYN